MISNPVLTNLEPSHEDDCNFTDLLLHASHGSVTAPSLSSIVMMLVSFCSPV